MMVVSMVAKKQERAVAFGSQLRREGVARPSLLSVSDQLAVEVPYRARWRALTSGKRCSGLRWWDFTWFEEVNSYHKERTMRSA